MREQVTIVRDGNGAVTVGVNGEHYAVLASPGFLPATFHALQWYGHSAGELEHKMATCDHCGVRSKKPNETVTDFTPYAPLVDAWQKAKMQAAQERARLEAEAKALERANGLT